MLAKRTVLIFCITTVGVLGAAYFLIPPSYSIRIKSLWYYQTMGYLPLYNPEAIAVLPPPYSISAGIWSDGIPIRVIGFSPPEFIDYLPPPLHLDTVDFNTIKCSPFGTYLECDKDSPLTSFGCDWLELAEEMSIGSPSRFIVATCFKPTDRHNPATDGFLYRVGCLRRLDVTFISYIDGEYFLIDSLELMKTLFAPITNTRQALSFAQMATGLAAEYEFKDLTQAEAVVYYTPVIEDTHVVETGDSYIVSLYQFQACGCVSWMTSNVNIIVEHDGNVTWGDTRPIYLQIDEGSCAD